VVVVVVVAAVFAGVDGVVFEIVRFDDIDGDKGVANA
jgi:hypothetical protein